MNIIPSKRIGIIGGEGKTGRQFSRLFRSLGFRVSVSGAGTKRRNAQILKTCDIVIFSVPLAQSISIIFEEVKNAKRTDQLILDMSSLKEQQVKAMCKARGEVIGMHPLFSPSTVHRGETIILCPARCTQETLQSLKKLFKRLSIRTIEMAPAEHDRMMAIIQVIPHFKSLLMASLMKALNVDVHSITETCTPTYELEFNVIGRFLDDEPELYMPIIFGNPSTPKILKTLRKILNDYIRIAKRRDLQSASKKYLQLKRFFGSSTAHARKRSEACIRVLSSSI